MSVQEQTVRLGRVAEAEQGNRLDRWLVLQKPEYSRMQYKELIEAGKVWVNGKVAKKSCVLTQGDTVELKALPEPRDFLPAPNAALKLELLYEDKDLLAVNKVAGMPCFPLRQDQNTTLANALMARFSELGCFKKNKREAGLLNRLDVGTSGIVLVARNEASLAKLKELQKQGAIEKYYLALCEGEVKAPQQIALRLKTNPKNKSKMMVCGEFEPKDQKRSTSIYDVQSLGQNSLVKLRIHRGQRHQIRAHMAAIGHPLVNDPLYGAQAKPSMKGYRLHCEKVIFSSALSEKKIEIHATLSNWRIAKFGK
ncbi:MAG: RluA family pseudouridine synthase [Myxococcales bacterium]|nr:MAG: RluA family pseudouridine synthase [Myxococcales bacterium]